MDQVTEPKRRGRPPKVEAESKPEQVDSSPAFFVPIPDYLAEVPLSEQCPSDIVLAFRSLLGVVCSFKGGRLVCVDGREFRAVIADGRVEVFE
jgi:hypothetical protein